MSEPCLSAGSPPRNLIRVPNRIKLCAIAKNEGAYLADWVFHHLHFGFDAVEIWINGTDDTSVDIMQAIGAVYEQVSYKVADKLLQKSLAQRKYFQYLAYARMAERALRQGFSHVGFLDLDEYWVPRDFATGIHSFVPEDDQVNVVSFPWWVDTPDRNREPFEAVIHDSVAIQPDPHVKSVIRVDDRITQIRTHTARTSSGDRLLVDVPFPLVDDREQQWGSFVPREYLHERRDSLPAAFVMHAIHRSETEYVASLAKGLRQVGADLRFKPNRGGYVPSDAPRLKFSPGLPQLRSYRQARSHFHDELGVGSLIRESERQTVERADALVAMAAADASVMTELRSQLHGVSSDILDHRYPGWDSPIVWWVDAVEVVEGRIWVTGWAFNVDGADVEFAVRDGSGEEWLNLPCESVPRPDVALVHPGAPLDCGFRIEVPAGVKGSLGEAVLMARVRGGYFWDVRSFSNLVTSAQG